MVERVQIRRSTTAGEVPTSLLPGELAVNLVDVKLYVGNAAGTVLDVTSALEGELATLTGTVTAQGGSITTNATVIASIAATLATATRTPAIADQDMAGHRLENLVQATVDTDAARLDQLGWVRITTANVTGTNAAFFSLPSGYWKFRVDWTLTSSGTGVFYMQMSLDGTALDSGAHYGWSQYDTAAAAFSTTTGGYVPLGNNRSGVARTDTGYIETVGGISGSFRNTNSSSTLIETAGAWNYIGGTPVKVLIATNAGLFTGGNIRLFGLRV